MVDDGRSNDPRCRMAGALMTSRATHVFRRRISKLNWLPTLSKKVLVLLPALVLVAIACGGTTTSGGTTFKGTKKVGLSTSLTGAVASYGQAGLNGIQMAIDDVNARGGVNGYKIELDQADDAAVASRGTGNPKRLILRDKRLSLFSPVRPLVCLPENPISYQNNIPFLTF